MFDTIIIGSGIAGASAAETAGCLGLSCLLITKETNPKASHSKKVELVNNNTVISLEQNITSFKITDKTGKEHFGKTVIICTGKTKKPLGIEGEENISDLNTDELNRLKEKQAVCVVGVGKKTLLFAHLLFKLNYRVYVCCLEQDFLDHSPFKAKVQNNPEITFFMGSKITKANKKEVIIQKSSGVEETLNISKTFGEFEHIPNTGFEILTLKNQSGEIKTDKNQSTNIPGLFAAGDACEGILKNELTIKAEGAKAALSAFEYIISR